MSGAVTDGATAGVTMEAPLRLTLVETSGEQSTRYTPLACMTLRAAIAARSELTGRVEVSLLAFDQGHSATEMALAIAGTRPDVLGLSCQGWCFERLMSLLPTVRQLQPAVRVVVGGNHVTGRGEVLLPRYPDIDLVVNGEGETTLCELLLSLMGLGAPLAEVAGLSFREGGRVVTTAARPRVRSLDEVASPYLGATDLAGYDVALLETNRGCPYRCAFCFWGGAVGQKIARARVDRVVAEIERIAEAGIQTVFLCDANFGILEQDLEIARAFVAARRRHGAPTSIQVNWAKNHAARVGAILRVLTEGGVATGAFVALQTTGDRALELAGRDARGRDKMMALARELLGEGLDVGCELIFGLPGETLAEFRRGYDSLYEVFPRVLVHPLWILPNTEYDDDRARFGLVTIRPEPAFGYDGVLRHHTLSIDENREGLALLLADEILVRSGWAPTALLFLSRFGGVAPSEVLARFERFCAARPDPLAALLTRAFGEIRRSCYFDRRLRGQVRQAVLLDPDRAHALLAALLDELGLAPDRREVAFAGAAHDRMLLPRPDLDEDSGERWSEAFLPFDVAAAARRVLVDPGFGLADVHVAPVRVRVAHAAGFCRAAGDAIDLGDRWRGRVQSIAPAAARSAS